jgi:polyvinyl alcohol dehydrogenase (cytochrome)
MPHHLLTRLSLALLFSGVFAGCGETTTPATDADTPAANTASGSVEVANPDGIEAINAARAARESLPGKGIYVRACASCHNGAVKKAPHKDMIGLMTPEAILAVLETGVMQANAATLSTEERRQVSEYLAGSAFGTAQNATLPACTTPLALDVNKPPKHRGNGMGERNNRRISKTDGGIDSSNAAALKPLWSLKFPGANRARSQPTLAGGVLFVGSHNGNVYALDALTGCQHWTYQAGGEVRTGIAIDSWESGDTGAKPRIYFGDVLGYAYAVDAVSGKLLWRQRADEHPNATITGTPTVYNGRLFVPVSSLEVSLAADPAYECCTASGSVAAYDVADGKLLWQTFTIPEKPKVQSQNRAGTNMWGPSGATVWNAPTIDGKRNQLYVGTGENMSSPATLTSDAIFAIDMDSGKVNWTFQATANDVWNVACDTENDHSCPPEGGPDFDFGAGTMLVTTAAGRDLVLAGQKSGAVHALDAATGALVWQRDVGRGGIQGGVHFGMAADDRNVYVPITDMPDGRVYTKEAKPGLHAVDIATGEIAWYTAAPSDVCGDRPFCHPGISQAVTLAGDVVFAGAMDGVLRIHNTRDGSELLKIDTTQEFTTVTGETTRGGSLGGAAAAVVQDGLAIISSGYGIYNHMPGNLLLVLALPEGQ